MTNCIMLKCDKAFGVFEYEVRFQPEIDNIQQRYKYVGQLREQIGSVKTFDGVTLYLPKQLSDRNSSFTTASLDGQGEVIVQIIFRRQKRLGECIHLYNVLFERIMRELKYQRVGKFTVYLIHYVQINNIKYFLRSQMFLIHHHQK